MNHSNFFLPRRSEPPPLLVLFLSALLALPLAVFSAATNSKNLPVAGKWDRFEQSFKSSITYSNAPQEINLNVIFTSPGGETTKVSGFWDGGKTWRVRFSPNQLGKWSYKTSCSDSANKGLHNRAGQFICSAVVGTNRFAQHGPVRVARDRRHLEHEDGTPFFWLADTVWNGPLLAQPDDWLFYADTRARQKFTVAQWAATLGTDAKGQTAFTGRERITINPDYFRRLDARIAALNHAGMLSAIVPLWEISLRENKPQEALPEEQAVLLIRYMVARWGYSDLAWLLTCEGDAKNIGRWRRIGGAVFGGVSHAPVLLFAGETYSVLNEFRDQVWVDIFGYQTGPDDTDDTVKWVFPGPLANDWKKQPARPLINLAPPYENDPANQTKERINADAVRRNVYWSLLSAPTSGVSYGARGVCNWDATTEPPIKGSKSRNLAMWQKSLFLPGAKQMTHLYDFFSSINFAQLRPAPDLVANQPGQTEPRRYIAATSTESKDLTVVYVPEDRALELQLEALPPSPSITWINPRTGEKSPAVAVVGARTCQFPTPGPGDWLLVMKAGK